MSIKTRATIEDLYKVEGKAELVHGEIVQMPPAAEDPSAASVEVVVSLHASARRAGQGRVFGDEVGFHVHLPHRDSLSPDAAYHVGPRMGCGLRKARPYLPSKSAAKTTMVPQPRERSQQPDDLPAWGNCRS